MQSIGPDKKLVAKLREFDSFSQSLKVASGEEGKYRCPICLRSFQHDELSKLTWDHFPPKIIGGSKRVLVCLDCNISSGRLLESTLPRYQKRSKFEKEFPGHFPMKYSSGGIVMRGAVRASPDKIEFHSRTEDKFESALEQFTRDLEEAYTDNKWDGKQFSLSTDKELSYSKRYLEVAFLKSAYLASFKFLGYSYILQEPVEKIREQILKPNERVFNWLSIKRPNQREGRFVRFLYISAPVFLRSFAVTFEGFQIDRDFGVFLPLPRDHKLSIYSNLARIDDLSTIKKVCELRYNASQRYEAHLNLIEDGSIC
jgi:hypothetical protein